jgi:UDP-N-acetylmuramoylalanine--D-glutamate ligase
VQTVQEAVLVAAKHSQAGDVVLLSPACASLDMFVSYQQRGDCFALAVKALAA